MKSKKLLLIYNGWKIYSHSKGILFEKYKTINFLHAKNFDDDFLKAATKTLPSLVGTGTHHEVIWNSSMVITNAGRLWLTSDNMGKKSGTTSWITKGRY